MNELQQIAGAWESALATATPCVLATVVRTTGSTYRRPGARMLMTAERWLAGAISGGCLEGDVLRRAWWRTAGGQPTVVTYDSTSDDDDDVAWRLGAGCNGTVELLLQRITPDDQAPLAFLRRCLDRRCPGVIVTVIATATAARAAVGEHLLLDDDGLWGCTIADPALARLAEGRARAALAGRRTIHASDGAGTDLFVEVIAPPRSLLVFGSGPDVPPLVQLAKAVGWHVTVVESRASRVSREQLALADRVVVSPPREVAARLELVPEASAVVMTHSYEQDRALLSVLLPSAIGYLGVLGPRRRTDRLLAELAGEGVHPTPAALARLHAPVGIDLGAEGPQEIALSIVAEVQAAAAARTPRSLRDLSGPVHAPPDSSSRSAATGGESFP